MVCGLKTDMPHKTRTPVCKGKEINAILKNCDLAYQPRSTSIIVNVLRNRHDSTHDGMVWSNNSKLSIKKCCLIFRT